MPYQKYQGPAIVVRYMMDILLLDLSFCVDDLIENVSMEKVEKSQPYEHLNLKLILAGQSTCKSEWSAFLQDMLK